MLEIMPIQEKALQKELCEKYVIPFRPDAFAYHATVDGEAVGFCQFGINGDDGIIYDFLPVGEKEDVEALIIMSRAVLSFLEYCGAEFAVPGENLTSERFIRLIGFAMKDDKITPISLKEFFSHNCGC